MNSRSSLLLLHKKPGSTSFASLYPIKHRLSKKVGHAGTLDKFAEGLLIVLTGSLTKLNPLFSNLDKRYYATIEFGIETDTLDPEGKIVKRTAVPSLATIETVLGNHFVGTILQAPPMYSAIHIDGVRSHRLARSGVEIEIPKRPVTIYSTRIIEWDSGRLALEVHCSKGTYIRSLARDLGALCGSSAYLSALTRTSIGPYALEEAVYADEVDEVDKVADKTLKNLLRLDNIAKIVVSDAAIDRLGNGRMPVVEDYVGACKLVKKDYAAVVDRYDNLQAVVSLDEHGACTTMVALVKGVTF